VRILHCIPSLAIKYGGPSQSAGSLMSAIAELPVAPAKVGLLYKPEPSEVPVSGRIARHCIHFAHERYWVPRMDAFRRHPAGS
jgi:hypothetical protein